MSLCNKQISLQMLSQRRLRLTLFPYVACHSFIQLLILHCRNASKRHFIQQYPFYILLWSYCDIWQKKLLRVCDHKVIRDQLHQITWKAKVRKFISSNLIWRQLILSSLSNRVIVAQWKLLCHSSITIPGLESETAKGQCERIASLLPPFTKLGTFSTGQTSEICLVFF